MKTAERSAAGHAIGHDPRRTARGPAAADDQNVGRERRQLGELPLENRAAVDDQRALVAAAEAARLTAREIAALHIVAVDSTSPTKTL